MFDAKLALYFGLGPPDGKDKSARIFTVNTDLSIRQDETHKRWMAGKRRDPHIPGSNGHWLPFKRGLVDPKSVVLIGTSGRNFIELFNFPECPTMQSNGTAKAWYLNYPAAQFLDKRWIGHWKIDQSVRQMNLPIVDPTEGWIDTAVKSCGVDTGWRYDTSSGVGGAGGFIIGGGYMNGQVVIKRKEPGDARRWNLDIKAVGAGVTTPGAGLSHSTEDMPSGGLTNVLASIMPSGGFKPERFAGTVYIFEGTGGGSLGASGAGALTTFMFMEGDRGDLIETRVKAVLQTYSTNTGMGTPGPGVSGILYAGVCRVSQRG